MSNFTTTANVVLSVNGKQAQKMLATLEKDAKKLENRLSAAAAAGDKTTMKKLQKELNQTRRLIDQLKGSASSVDATLRNLNTAAPRDLNKALKTLQQQLNGIDRGSAAWDAHIEKIKAVKEELRRVNEAMRPDMDLMERINAWWEKWENAVVSAAAVITGTVLAGRSAVNAYAEMEQEMANVRKFTGMTAEDVEALNVEFQKIDTRTSRESLNKLAQEAGRLGKTSVEDVLGFVRAADKINVALDDLGKGATIVLSKLTGIFGDEKRLGTEKSLLAVGSVINDLSQNCSASASYLAEFASRMGGVGAQAGMTVQQLLAFGAVLDSNNQMCEASSTALSQVITRIYQNPAKYAKVAGMSVEKFTKLVKTDMNGALLEFFKTLRQAGSMKVLAPMFKDMGENGSRAISAMSTLASRIEELKWQQDNANKAFAEAKSIGIEYDVQNNTVQAGLDKAKDAVHELAVSLGKKLQPVMRLCISSTTATLKIIDSLIGFFFRYKVEIMSAVTAIAAYNLILLVMNTRTLIVSASTRAFYAAVAFGAKVVPVLRLTVVALVNSIQYLTKGLEVNYVMQMRWRKAMGSMKMANWVGLVLAVAAAIYAVTSRMKENREEAARLKREQQEYEKSLVNINEAAGEYGAKELTRLQTLYIASTDEAKAREERVKAAEKLQKLYPDVFRNFNTEQIMLGESAKAYIKLRDSIVEVANARAAADKITENQKEILTLEQELPALEEAFKKADGELLKADAKQRRAQARGITQSPSNDNNVAAASYIVNLAGADIDLADAQKTRDAAMQAVAENIRKRRLLERSNAYLTGKYKRAVEFLPQPHEAEEMPIKDYQSHGNGGKGNAPEDRFAQEKEWREKLEAKIRILYGKGEIDYVTHTETMTRISIKYYDKLLERTDLSEQERLDLEAEREELRRKQREQFAARSMEEEEKRYDGQLAELKQFYLDGDISKEAYDLKTEEAEIEHQMRLTALTAEGSKERMQAEARLSQLLISQMERRQAEMQKREQEYAELKKEFFGDNLQERQAQLQETLDALQAVYIRELASASDNAAEKLRIEEAYEKARLAIKRKYGALAEEDNRNFMQRWNQDAREWLEGDVGKAVTESVDTLVSGMSAIFSQVTSMVQADMEVQTAAVNKRYEAEISAAEGNTYQVKRLEKQKQAELARIKNEANRKMFGMQIIQAVAQTATNALAAFGSAAAVPVIGYILAPIAAAMAVAAGAVQVATIRKQAQAAQSQGYAEGGFTRPGGKWETAGVVHAGEWVASQKLVNDPRTRPLLEALDYAQRTNTIGSLRMEDVSRSITAPAVLASRSSSIGAPVINVSPTLQVEQNAEYADTMRRLAARLNEPFVTVNTVTGDHGIKKAQSEYDRLMQNKSPKTRR